MQEILYDKKVRYIINELQKRVQNETEQVEQLPDKVIICEGQIDEIVLQAIARKLNYKVTIVIDSDEDEDGTKSLIAEKIVEGNYELAIINSCIEDWFVPEVKDFSKLKLIQSIDTIVENADFKELSEQHESFAKVIGFIQK